MEYPNSKFQIPNSKTRWRLLYRYGGDDYGGKGAQGDRKVAQCDEGGAGSWYQGGKSGEYGG